MLNGLVLRLWLQGGPPALHTHTHTHSNIKQSRYLSHIQPYKVELHWSVYAILTISNTWASSRPQTIFWWSLIHLVIPGQLISGGNVAQLLFVVNRYQSIISTPVSVMQ